MSLNKVRPMYQLIVGDRPTHALLPYGIDTSNLIDVTPVGAAYRVFVDRCTGERIDGAKYAEHIEEMNRSAEEKARRLMPSNLRNLI